MADTTDRERAALNAAKENLKRAAVMMSGNRGGLDRGAARRAGKQFGTTREVWKTLGYPEDVEIEFEEYLGRYLRSDVAGAIVDAPAQTTWRRGVDVVEIDEDGNPVDPDGETDFESDIRRLFDRVSAISKFERVDRVSGIGYYAVYLIGSLKGEDLEAPLEDDPLEGVEDIGFLSIFREDHAEIVEVGTDPFDERFELPTFYEVTFNAATGDDGNGKTRREKVHHSRVVHVADDPLEDDLLGRPRLQRVYNRLEDLLKLVGSSAEMFWSNVGGVIHAAADPDAVFADPDGDQTEAEVIADFAETLVEQLNEQRRVVASKGFDLSHVGAGTPDPTGPFEVVKALLTAGAAPPESIIFGTERGDVAKSQDVESWLGSIAERQERHAGPNIAQPFIDKVIALGVVSEPAAGPDAYRLEWPSLFELDESAKAEILSNRSKAAKAIADAIMSGGDTAIRVIRTLVPELEGILDDELEALGRFIDEEDDEVRAALASVGAQAFADGNGYRSRRGIRKLARVVRSLEAAELLATTDVAATPGLEVVVGEAVGEDTDGRIVYRSRSRFSSDGDAEPGDRANVNRADTAGRLFVMDGNRAVFENGMAWSETNIEGVFAVGEVPAEDPAEVAG